MLSQGFKWMQCRYTANILPSQNLPSELLLTVVNNFSVYDNTALSQQSRGIHALCDVRNRQKYHQIKFGRKESLQAHKAVLQVGLGTLLAILRNPSLGDYVRRVELYGTGMIDFDKNSNQDSVLTPEDIDKIKQAILRAGFQDALERESILSMLLRNPAEFQSLSSMETLQFKDALITLLVAASPNLESMSMYPLVDYIRSPSTGDYERVNLLQKFLCQASASAESVPYCQNLRNFSFYPDETLNQYNEYVEDPYYDRLNMIRRLPAVESLAFKLVTWSNEAGIPPPTRSANYSKISFTHSRMEIWDLCCIIKSANFLKSFIFSIGGRSEPDSCGIPILDVTPILKSLWIHREVLEKLNLDMESQIPRKDLYDKEYQPCLGDEMSEEDREVYEEQWADELQELAAPEIAPARVSLKDFPRLRNLSIGAHTLCYLARGTGDGETQLDSKSFNLIDHIPSTLESLRIYSHGQPMEYPYLDHESDLDVYAQIEQLAHEKDAKLPGLKILEGVDPCIPNGRTVKKGSDPDDLELFWKDPDDDRFD
ncbi:hypothetical protein N7494_000435 [Penicillium frequentans]|uniref:F-box domain-containing protein n=1 Tax=Penicillium frequentans TaxID=3151616 RepID=A0AAD6GL25_9EURO|nr:hypothetical protein N7494_000435 [Penicillium glabrum]